MCVFVAYCAYVLQMFGICFVYLHLHFCICLEHASSLISFASLHVHICCILCCNLCIFKFFAYVLHMFCIFACFLAYASYIPDSIPVLWFHLLDFMDVQSALCRCAVLSVNIYINVHNMKICKICKICCIILAYRVFVVYAGYCRHLQFS